MQLLHSKNIFAAIYISIHTKLKYLEKDNASIGNKNKNIHIFPYLMVSSLWFQWSAACSSCHQAKGDVHTTQVASPAQVTVCSFTLLND